MSPWFGKTIFLLGTVAGIAIRAPHDSAKTRLPVAESRKGLLERALLVAVGLGVMLLPLVYIATPLLAFGDYPLEPAALGAGVAVLSVSLWLFHRAHADLGKNFSFSLELREGHSLVTSGVYAYVRHPMYSAIFLQTIAQALLLPNAVAGPSGLVTFALMFLLRFGSEERMMRDRFGAEYDAYCARTRRLVPGVF